MRSDKYLKKAMEWHRRAKDEEDVFVKFAMDYLAFEALLHWLNQNFRHYQPSSNTTRKLIQRIKQDSKVKEKFLGRIREVDLSEIIRELTQEPLKNVSRQEDRWWNCERDRVDECNIKIPANNGKLRNEADFINMVEFVYRARNNLFHGHKNPRIERDEFIVKTANIFLEPLIDSILEVYHDSFWGRDHEQ